MSMLVLLARGILFIPEMMIRMLLALPFMLASIAAGARGRSEDEERLNTIINRILGD